MQLNDLAELARDPKTSSDWGPALCFLTGLAWSAMIRQPAERRDILEIGVQKGMSTRALLAATKMVPGSILWSNDKDASCRDSIPRELWGSWRFKHSTSHMFLSNPKLRARQYAFALVDGDHQYHVVTPELALLEGLIAPGGMIVMDDCWKDLPGSFKAFNDFTSARPWSKTLWKYGIPGAYSGWNRQLGIIQFED